MPPLSWLNILLNCWNAHAIHCQYGWYRHFVYFWVVKQYSCVVSGQLEKQICASLWNISVPHRDTNLNFWFLIGDFWLNVRHAALPSIHNSFLHGKTFLSLTETQRSQRKREKQKFIFFSVTSVSLWGTKSISLWSLWGTDLLRIANWRSAARYYYIVVQLAFVALGLSD